MQKMLQVLYSKVIPWTMNGAVERLIIARPEMSQAMMPFGVKIEPRSLVGRRIVRKDNRRHANQRLHVADWPDDNLHELAVSRLVCVVKGDITYLAEKYKINSAEGNFILIPPHTLHQCTGPYF